MWKRIKETHYFLLFSTDHGYEICITDNINVWTTLYSRSEFLAKIKRSNEGLELPDDNEYLQKGIHLVSNIDYLRKFDISNRENGKTLLISLTMSFGYPFYLKCKLTKGSDKLFYQKVTRPLLKSICDLRESQSELRRLLIKKDTEIEEYKSESGEVARYLQTVPFNDAEHMFKHKVYDENFSLSPKTITENVKYLDNTVLRQMQNQSQNQNQNQAQNQIEAVRQEPVPNVRPELSARPEPQVAVKQEPDLIEPDTTVHIDPVPCRKNGIKSEDGDETSVSITASVSYQPEVRRETLRPHVPRKRTKFNL
ncbi:hypothetical protein HF086_008727 [Spodoptera exigua]|uniref:Non-homologous end-joining factor 1 n=1 Tax=Spodoptera exigua TaxID=7107 RepID=A0A922MR83_SPOEX|nr:hypothetical protein HF086_008727 [Spodoptera exigua]